MFKSLQSSGEGWLLAAASAVMAAGVHQVSNMTLVAEQKELH
jgi:hypothetical protein